MINFATFAIFLKKNVTIHLIIVHKIDNDDYNYPSSKTKNQKSVGYQITDQ